uniref:Uncharacterized protein n=1 Tax=Anguilla anguilla TaxID=7936 RepID=A0A0E9Y2M8_ANGAN
MNIFTLQRRIRCGSCNYVSRAQ